MGAEWVCFKCSTHNEMAVRYCISCGAQRPLAAGAFASMGDSDNLELPVDAMHAATDEAKAYDIDYCSDRLHFLADEWSGGRLKAKVFVEGVYGVYEIINRLLLDLRQTVGNLVVSQSLGSTISMGFGDVEYMFNLALMQFETVRSRRDMPALRVGLMLANKAIWCMKRLKTQVESAAPEEEANKDLLGQSIVKLIDGQLDDEAYSLELEEDEKKLLAGFNEARQMLDDGLAMAAKFDGKEHRQLMRSSELLRQSTSSLVKVIASLHPIKLVKRMKAMEASATGGATAGAEAKEEATP